jgi:hypothetical protein
MPGVILNSRLEYHTATYPGTGGQIVCQDQNASFVGRCAQKIIEIKCQPLPLARIIPAMGLVATQDPQVLNDTCRKAFIDLYLSLSDKLN